MYLHCFLTKLKIINSYFTKGLAVGVLAFHKFDKYACSIEFLQIELLRTNGPAWAPFISQWTLSLLGEMSSRHAALVTKVNA